MQIIVMTRLPRTGRNKTRLIPALGAEGATAFHERLARHAIGRASSFCNLHPAARLTVRLEGGTSIEGKSWLGADTMDCREQSPGDLGHRMESAAEEAFEEGADRLVIIGTDCPSIDESILGKAFEALTHAEVVFGPAADGGYYLVGMSKPTPSIFRNIPWGGGDVLEKSLTAAKEAALRVKLLEVLSDVDIPEDLTAAEAHLQKGSSVSVIIPTFNEAANISPLLEKIQASQPHEIIVADGGSSDATVALAKSAGAFIVSAARGRAVQMNHGASLATGEFLLFLHADTLPPAGFPGIVSETLNRPGTSAGAFNFQLDDQIGTSSLIEKLVHLRCQLLAAPYGDQGLFLRRSLFEETGGFPEWPCLEDLGFVRSLRKRGKIRIAPESAITSSRRWETGGTVRTFLKHQAILAGFLLGVPPRFLAKIR